MNAFVPQIRPDILLQSGNCFDFLVPHTCNFNIEDIAHGLSNICRFGGHTHKFYSVAQHSVLVSRVLSLQVSSLRTNDPSINSNSLGMAGLMHDSAEAFIGDIPRPLKQLLPDYKVIEERIERAIFPIFGITYPLPQAVKYVDLVLLATEQRDLMPGHDDEWALIAGIEPLQEIIAPWTHEEAFREFMARYEELGGKP